MFAHGAVGHWINPSRWTHWAIYHVPARVQRKWVSLSIFPPPNLKTKLSLTKNIHQSILKGSLYVRKLKNIHQSILKGSVCTKAKKYSPIYIKSVCVYESLKKRIALTPIICQRGYYTTGPPCDPTFQMSCCKYQFVLQIFLLTMSHWPDVYQPFLTVNKSMAFHCCETKQLINYFAQIQKN